MVRFSDRATGTHIITTREIEKDLLMLNFYPIKGLKKGKKEAQIRTFFSKNDYITQDLTTEKVKWLTAAFDRMDCISLYEYHWDRETGNRYTPNMFFWTDSDIDRMRKFFKEWSTEKDDKDWTAVTRFQDMIKQRRLDEKHAKETNPIDTIMGTVKEIPEDFKKWVSEKAMSFSRYLIYSTRSKNEALVHCTHCNGVTLVDRTKIRLRNNEKGICPLSIRGLQSRSNGEHFEGMIIAASRFYEERGIAAVDKTPEAFKVLKAMDRNRGQFICCFTKQAQPDFKGILMDSTMILFDAKHTDKDKIGRDVVTAEQQACFERYMKLGAMCFLVVMN